MITGKIMVLTVPQVKPGAYIDINIETTGNNPNGSFINAWKMYIVAKDSLGHKEMVKDADVRSSDFHFTDSLRLWQMPTSTITLEIRLYGHDEIKPWDWAWWT